MTLPPMPAVLGVQAVGHRSWAAALVLPIIVLPFLIFASVAILIPISVHGIPFV